MTEDLDQLIGAALARLSRTDAAPNSNDLACALKALLLVAQGRNAAPPAGEPDQPGPAPGLVAVSPVAQTWARDASRSESLAAGLAARDNLGRARYGRALETHNGRDALRDAREEILDGVHYLTQAILERGGEDVVGGPVRALRTARTHLGEAWAWLERVAPLRAEAPPGLNAPSPDRLT